jgi:hypothetical protein
LKAFTIAHLSLLQLRDVVRAANFPMQNLQLFGVNKQHLLEMLNDGHRKPFVDDGWETLARAACVLSSIDIEQAKLIGLECSIVPKSIADEMLNLLSRFHKFQGAYQDFCNPRAGDSPCYRREHRCVYSKAKSAW